MRKILHNQKRLYKKHALLIAMLIACSYISVAQQLVRGTVKDVETGVAIPGVTVMIEGSGTGAITDLDGKYSIEAAEGDVLVFSFLGFQTQSEPVGGRTSINISLKEEVSELSEVVVMGYSEKSRRELTASAVTLESKDIQNVTSSNVENMLQGKVAGVTVTTSTGAPGASAEIRIRGVNSLTADRAPLVVVDGMIGGTYQPNDVASLTILKDAAATALYGSLASGGVIIVTTKGGSKDSEIEFSTSIGKKEITTGNFSVMNGKDLYELQEIMWGDDKVNFLRVRPQELEDLNYNWMDKAYHSADVRNYYLAARGGNEKSNYSISLDYWNDEGTLLNTGYERISLRTNLGFQPKENVSLKTNFAVIHGKSSQDFWNWRYDPFLALPWDNPFEDGQPKYIDNTTSLTWYGRDKENIFHSAKYNYNNWKDLSITGNAFLTVDVTDWLSLQSRNKVSLYSSRSDVFYDPRTKEGKANEGILTSGEGASTDAISTFLITVNKDFGDHELSAFSGVEGNYYTYEDLGGTGWNVPIGLDVLSAASEPVSLYGYNFTSTRMSYLSEVNYSYMGKYFLTGVFRADASSQFSPDNRWGYFPGASASWIVSSEEFLANNKAISYMKLRASYGEVGNDNVGTQFPYLSYYDLTSTYNGSPGATIPSLANDQITWETLISRNVGLDMALFNRVNLTAEYYNNSTEDMLLNVQLPLSSGFETQVRNVGSVNNQGVELTIGADVFAKPDGFGWNTSFNASMNMSEIKSLGGSDTLTFGTDAQQVSVVGESLRQWYLPKWKGVDPANGDPLWEKVNRDENGNVVSRETTNNYNEAEYQAVGSVLPKVYGGWTNTFTYKGFTLNVLLSYQYGNKVYHSARQLFDNDGAYTEYNLMELQDDWKRWEKPGDKATHPLPVRGGNKLSNSVSSRYLEDGSYIRLRNVSLSYAFSRGVCDALRLKSLNVALSGDNLYTWTKFSGMDPEARISVAAYELPGFQDFKYPISKQYLLKLTAKF